MPFLPRTALWAAFILLNTTALLRTFCLCLKGPSLCRLAVPPLGVMSLCEVQNLLTQPIFAKENKGKYLIITEHNYDNMHHVIIINYKSDVLNVLPLLAFCLSYLGVSVCPRLGQSPIQVFKKYKNIPRRIISSEGGVNKYQTATLI